jgi:hypothetical protein
MPDKDNLGAVLQPIGYRWQNNRDGLQQDDAVAAMRASTGSSGFHEMNHPVVVAFDWQKGNDIHNPRPSTMNVQHECTPTIGTTRTPAVAFQQNTRDEVRLMNGDGQIAGALAAEAGMKQQNYLAQSATTPAVAHTLRGEGFNASEDGTGRGTPLVPQSMTVRRLTPRECERLQGFPDDWTMIPYRGKPPEECPDGPRYKALGNSMACNCMAWIGERIAAYENQNP